MKLKLLITLWLWFCLKLGLGQNYIPNYSFEDTLTRTTPLFLPADWVVPTNESYDYYTPLHNSSAQHYQFYAPQNLIGYQQAKSGNSYIGIKLYDLYTSVRRTRREYIQLTVFSCSFL